MHEAWEQETRIPAPVRSVFRALQFDAPSLEMASRLSRAEWGQALEFCDRSYLTLPFAAQSREVLPKWVHERTERNLTGNIARLNTLREALKEIAEAMRPAGIEFLLLKGFTHVPEFAPRPELRQQTDLDLFVPREQAAATQNLLQRLDFEPIRDFAHLPTDHLPLMIRRSDYRWSGDYFDPLAPAAVEVHFRFWNESNERIRVPGLEGFWERRVPFAAGPARIWALDPADRLAYCSLHVLRHLVRGGLKAGHVWELAHFLEQSSERESFWREWTELHPAALRRLQAIAFCLARAWFCCRVPPAAAAEVEALPASVQTWFSHFALSPAAASFRPNKDELWLHWDLVESRADRLAVARRKILPTKSPGPMDLRTPRGVEPRPDERLVSGLRNAGYLLSRGAYHLAALPSLVRLVLIRVEHLGLLRRFWVYLGAASLMHLGLFVFVVIYNLYLVSIGYEERFVGAVTTAMTLGQIAGALPAGALGRRWGLKTLLLSCFAGMPLASLLRAMLSGEPALLLSAFVAGVFFGFWAVSIAPAVTQCTRETKRAEGFSLFFGAGIGLGVLGGLLGGWLPGWLGAAGPTPDSGSLRAALIVSCAIMVAGFPVARTLRFDRAAPEEKRVFPRGSFIRRFLAAVALWNLAVGAFNPFFNTYFARHWKLAVEQIGSLFSAGQLLQAAAVMLAPLALRRWGRVRAIAAMQMAAGITLAALAFSGQVWLASGGYLAYMSFQWMSEPGIYGLLMDRVRAGERSGASGLNYMVIFTCHAIAAWVAGTVISQAGYPALLAATASLALAAAIVFRILLRPFDDA